MVPSSLSRLRVAAKSAGVGAAATLLDLATLALLVHALAIAPRIAGPLALLVGVAMQFVGNKLWAFGDRGRDWGRKAAAFGAVEALAFLLNLVGFEILAVQLGLPSIPARIVVSAVVYGGFCLPLWSVVFRPSQFAAAPSPSPSPSGG